MADWKDAGGAEPLLDMVLSMCMVSGEGVAKGEFRPVGCWMGLPPFAICSATVIGDRFTICEGGVPPAVMPPSVRLICTRGLVGVHICLACCVLIVVGLGGSPMSRIGEAAIPWPSGSLDSKNGGTAEPTDGSSAGDTRYLTLSPCALVTISGSEPLLDPGTRNSES